MHCIIVCDIFADSNKYTFTKTQHSTVYSQSQTTDELGTTEAMASDREKLDKSKMNSSVKHIPKDAQVIMSILKELNVTEYEPRVINQLLEFTYRYITCILDDAKIYANHAKKKVIDLEDVKLASQMTMEKAFTSPPPREVLLELARSKNMAALPLIKPHCGLRLPPDRHCLLSANYKLRAADIQPKKMTKSALDRVSGKNKSTGATILKRQSIATIPKTQTVTIPKPVFKFSGNSSNKSAAGTTTTPSSASSSSATAKVQPPATGSATAVQSKIVQEVKMELDEEYNSSDSKGLKRKHDDNDEFEMVE